MPTFVLRARLVVPVDYDKPLVERITGRIAKQPGSNIPDNLTFDTLDATLFTTHFPSRGKGKRWQEVHLLEASNGYSAEDALAALGQEILHPAEVRELVGIALRCPGFLQDFGVIALDEPWRDEVHNEPRIPCLGRYRPRPIGRCFKGISPSEITSNNLVAAVAR